MSNILKCLSDNYGHISDILKMGLSVGRGPGDPRPWLTDVHTDVTLGGAV